MSGVPSARLPDSHLLGQHCVLPVAALSVEAEWFRAAWADRFPDWDWDASPLGVEGDEYRHFDGVPFFRSPLTARESRSAALEFHERALRALCGPDGELLVVTFRWQPDPDDRSALVGGGDPWLVWGTEPEEQAGRTALLVERTNVSDPRVRSLLKAQWDEVHDGWFVSPNLRWKADTHSASCFGVLSGSASDFDAVERAKGEVWARWGIESDRQPSIDLRDVVEGLETRFVDWSRSGVKVSGLRFFAWDPQRLQRTTLDALPADPSDVDGLAFTLRRGKRSGDFFIYDTGMVSLHTDPDEDDPNGDTYGEFTGDTGRHALAELLARADQFAGWMTAHQHPVSVLSRAIATYQSWLPSDRPALVDAAVQALVDGLDSPLLRELAGLDPDDVEPSLVEALVDELGFESRTQVEAQEWLVWLACREVAAGTMSPRDFSHWMYEKFGDAEHPSTALAPLTELDLKYHFAESSGANAGDVDALARRAIRAFIDDVVRASHPEGWPWDEEDEGVNDE